MQEALVRRIQETVRSPLDFGRFPRIPRGVLSAVLLQNSIKKARKFSYRLKVKDKELWSRWKRGEPITELAKRVDLMPLAVAFGLREHLGFGRKNFAATVREVEGKVFTRKVFESKRDRFKREISDACRVDFLHAPSAMNFMRTKGQLGEKIAHDILTHFEVKFKTEKEQDKGGKTPDFLFSAPHKLFGFEAFWLESKACFGELSEVKEDYKTQLKFYHELFGSGVVVYWLGYTDEAKEFLRMHAGERILLISGHDLRKYAPKAIEELFHFSI